MADATTWAGRIHDARRGRVVFLAHCLLNENTRYLGGAGRAGPVKEIVEACLAQDVAMVQLPCPEQHAWGGVLKRRLLLFYGAGARLPAPVRSALLPVLLWYTKRIYRRLARETADQIEDYRRSGATVLGIVGVDASPSCGVNRTLDVDAALARLSSLQAGSVSAGQVNAIVAATATAGRGMYVALLQRELADRGLAVPFTAHDLLEELAGKRSSVDIPQLLAKAGVP